jgi:hypothetical protein
VCVPPSWGGRSDGGVAKESVMYFTFSSFNYSKYRLPLMLLFWMKFCNRIDKQACAMESIVGQLWRLWFLCFVRRSQVNKERATVAKIHTPTVDSKSFELRNLACNTTVSYPLYPTTKCHLYMFLRPLHDLRILFLFKRHGEAITVSGCSGVA